MKLFKYMTWLLVAMTMSFGLAACGDDDDDDGPDSGKSEIVGKWQEEDDYSYFGICLNEGGSGYMWEWEEEYGLDKWAISWEYNGKVLHTESYDGEEVFDFSVKYLDDKTLVLNDDGEAYELTRVKRYFWE